MIEVPGYDVSSRLGAHVWQGRQSGTAEPVALQRLTAPVDAAAVRRQVALLRTVDTAHLLRVREVVEVGEDVVVVVHLAAGGSLAALLERRADLQPGEVVTVAAPIAQALAALHARGLVHGSLTSSDVLFTADGMPLLSGLCRAGDRSDADDDVRALLALCRRMSPGGLPLVPRAIATTRRDLDAAAVALTLLRSYPPRPVQLAASAPGSASRRPTRLVPGLALLLVALAAVGWMSDRAEPVLPPREIAVPTDWRAVLDVLDADRAAALASGDVARLRRVHAPDSTGLAADTAAVTELREAGRRAIGVRHTFISVTPTSIASAVVRLRVVDLLPAFVVVGADGAVVFRTPARGERTQRVELVRTAAGWRLRDVRPA